MAIQSSALFQLAKTSAALLGRPLSSLEFERLQESAGSDATGKQVLNAFFNLESVSSEIAGALGPTPAVVSRVFFARVLGLDINAEQLRVVQQDGPQDPAELTQWLLGLLETYPGNEPIITQARATLAVRVATNLNLFADLEAQALITSLSTALVDWTPDTETLKLGTDALKAGASLAQIASVLIDLPAGQQIYAGLQGEAFETKLLVQLLGRSPSALESAAVREVNIVDKGSLAASLIAALDAYPGPDQSIVLAANQLQSKTEAGLLIQALLGAKLQPQAIDPQDAVFAAGQQITIALANAPISSVEKIRYLTELAKSPSLLSDISQNLLRDLQLSGPIAKITQVSFSADSGSSASDLITSVTGQTIAAKLTMPLGANEVLQASLDSGKTFVDITRFVKGTELTWPRVSLAEGSNSLQFKVSNNFGAGPLADFGYRLDTASPAQAMDALAIDADSGPSASDFKTGIARQTVSIVLSEQLGPDDRLFGSVDNGQSYVDVTAFVTGKQLAWKTDLLVGSNTLKFELRDLAGNVGTVISKAYVLEVNEKGRAIDGYLSGSTVFVDANGDGLQGSGEASTKTDADGFFTLSGQTAGIIVQGGVDKSSGKPFEGSLKAPAGSSIINPLTTIVAELVESGRTPGEAEKLVASAFGIDTSKTGSSLLSFDPIAATLSGTPEARAAALQVAAASAQVVNIAISIGSALSGAAGGETKLSTAQASAAVMSALAAKIEQASTSSTTTQSVKLSDPATVGLLIGSAAKELPTSLPTSLTQAVQGQVQTITAAAASVIAQTAAQIDTVLKSASDPSAALAKIVQVQVAAQGVVSDQIQAAVQSGKVESLATALSSQALSQIVASTAVQSISGAATDAALISAAGVNGATTTPPVLVTPEVPPVVSPTTPTSPTTTDTTPPTLTITSDKSTLKVGETATLSLSFSESVNLANANSFLSVAGTDGTISGLTGSGSSYTATFTPAGNLEKTVSVSVTGSFTDTAGNAGTAPTAKTLVVDTKPVALVDVQVTRSTKTLVLTYDDAAMLASTLAPANFSVTTPIGGVPTANAVSTVVVSGKTVTLTLSSSFDAGSVGLTYQPTGSGDSLTGIRDGSGNLTASTTQGIVADGYLRGAEVWIDKLDGSAPVDTGIRSNAGGQFFLPSILPNGQPLPTGSIIVKGGFNVDTGVPNKVTMATPPGSTTVNPLTTMTESLVRKDPSVVAALTGNATASEKALAAVAAAKLATGTASASVAAALGLPATTNLTNYNPLAELAEDNTSAAALAVHKAAASIATLLSVASTGANSADNQATALSSLVTKIESAALGGDTVDLKDSALVQAALGAVSATEAASALEALTSISQATSGSSITKAQAVALDATPPDAPREVRVLSGQTNNQLVSVFVGIDTADTDGTAVVAGDTVSITLDGVVIGTKQVSADDFIDQVVELTPELPLPEGNYVIRAFVTDQSGKSSNDSESTASFSIDLTPPSLPIIQAIEGDGTINAAEEGDGFVIVGSAEPDASIVVTLLGTAREPIAVGSSGEWTFSVTAADLDAMGEGSETLSVFAVDPAGNVSDAAQVVFVVDTEAPVVEITLDQALDNVGTNQGVLAGADVDNSRVTGILGSSDFVTGLLGGSDPLVGGVAYKVTDDQTISLSGSLSRPLDTNEKLVVYDGQTLVGEVAVSSNSNETSWTYTTPALSDGDHSLRAFVVDGAGNQSSPSSVASLRVAANAPTDTVTINALSNNRVKDGGSLSLQGTTTAAAGATVTIFKGASELATASVVAGNSVNTWSATLAGNVLSLGASDIRAAVKSGDLVGPPSAVLSVVRDDTAPLASIAVVDSVLGNTETTKLVIRFSEPLADPPTLSASYAAPGQIPIEASGLGTLSTARSNRDGSVSYELVFDPGQNLSGTVTVNLAAGYTDLAGNSGVAVQSQAITVDTTAPSPPSFALIAGDSPGSASINATELADGTAITGTASGASKVDVVLRNTAGKSFSQRVSVDSDGSWSIQLDRGDIAPFGQGSVSVTAIAIDASGNRSSDSTGSFTVATARPDIVSLSLSDSVSTDLIRIKTLAPTLAINASSGATIKVDWTNDGTFDGDPVQATGFLQALEGPVDADGGRNVLRVRVEDSAGNFTERTLGYEADAIAPAVYSAQVPINNASRTATLFFNEPINVSTMIGDNGQFNADVVASQTLPSYSAAIVPMPGQSSGYSNSILLTFSGTDNLPTSGSLSLNAASVLDRAGNSAMNDLQFSITAPDTSGPTVTLVRQGATVGSTSEDIAFSRGEAANYLLTFSEPVREFSRDDISFRITTSGSEQNQSAGTIGPLVRISDTQYRFTLTPVDLKEVNAALVVGTGFKDLADNAPATDTTLSLTIDTNPPTLNVSAGALNKDTSTGSLTVPLTFTFDTLPSISGQPASVNEVVSFLQSAVPSGRGSLSNISGSSTTYTATYSAPTGEEGRLFWSFPAWSDQAGNRGAIAAVPSIAYDTSLPAATITTGFTGTASKATSVINYNLSLSESVTSVDSGGLSPSAFTVTNGTVQSVVPIANSAGKSWNVIVAPSANVSGQLSLALNAGTVKDASGNLNQQASHASVAIDTAAPVATGAVIALKARDDSTVSQTTSQNVLKLSGTLSSELGSGESLLVFDSASPQTPLGTATVTGTAWSFTTASLSNAAHTFSVVPVDTAGNRGTAGATQSVTVNATLPTGKVGIDTRVGLTNTKTPTVAGIVTGPSSAGDKVQIYSDGRVVGTYQISSPIAAGVSSTWSVDLSTLDEGKNSLVAVYENNVGVQGNKSLSYSLAVDSVRPTLTITDNVAGTATGAVTYTIKFSEPIQNLDISDLSVSNGGQIKSLVPLSDAVFQVLVDPPPGAQGVMTLTVNHNGPNVNGASSIIQDRAGNVLANILSADPPQAFDTKAPALNPTNPNYVLDKASRVAVIDLDEPVLATGAVALGKLKAGVQISLDRGLSFKGLESADQVSITAGGDVQIRFAQLPLSDGLRVRMLPGAVTDDAGNASVGFVAPNSIDTRPPQIQSINIGSPTTGTGASKPEITNKDTLNFLLQLSEAVRTRDNISGLLGGSEADIAARLSNPELAWLSGLLGGTEGLSVTGLLGLSDADLNARITGLFGADDLAVFLGTGLLGGSDAIINLSPTATKNQYQVVLTGPAIASGNGELALGLAQGFSIFDLAGNNLAPISLAAPALSSQRYVLDNTNPAIASINRGQVAAPYGGATGLAGTSNDFPSTGPNGETTLDRVSFIIRFNETVRSNPTATGLLGGEGLIGGEDFVVGLLSGASLVSTQDFLIESVSRLAGSQTDFVVRVVGPGLVSHTSGELAIRPQSGSPFSIFDLAGNLLSGSSPSSQNFTIDNIPPQISAIARETTAGVLADGRTNADELKFIITFNEAVAIKTNVNGVLIADSLLPGLFAADDISIRLNGSLVNPTRLELRPVPNSATVFSITVGAAEIANGNGALQIELAPNADVRDLAGNMLTASRPDPQTFLLDNMAPPVSGITVTGVGTSGAFRNSNGELLVNTGSGSLSFGYEGALNDSADSTGRFEYAVTSGSIPTADNFSAANLSTNTDTKSVTISNLSFSSNPFIWIRATDSVGNVTTLAPAAQGIPIRFDATAPSVQLVARDSSTPGVSPDGRTSADVLTYRVTFSEAIRDNPASTSTGLIGGSDFIGPEDFQVMFERATGLVGTTDPANIARSGIFGSSGFITGLVGASDESTGGVDVRIQSVKFYEPNIYLVTVGGSSLVEATGKLSLQFTDNASILDLAGNSLPVPVSLPANSQYFALDNTQPTVTQITRATAAERTNSDSIDFTVRFSMAVDQITVNPADFRIIVPPGSTVPANINVTTVAKDTSAGAGANDYKVTVAGSALANYNGSVGLGLSESPTIQTSDSPVKQLRTDYPTNPNEKWIIDNEMPAISRVLRASTLSEVNAATEGFSKVLNAVKFKLVFSEPIDPTTLISSNFKVALSGSWSEFNNSGQLVSGGYTDVPIPANRVSVSAQNPSDYSITITVNAEGLVRTRSDGTNEPWTQGNLRVTGVTSGLRDVAGNPVSGGIADQATLFGGLPSNLADNQGYTVDTIAPYYGAVRSTLVSATTGSDGRTKAATGSQIKFDLTGDSAILLPSNAFILLFPDANESNLPPPASIALTVATGSDGTKTVQPQDGNNNLFGDYQGRIQLAAGTALTDLAGNQGKLLNSSPDVSITSGTVLAEFIRDTLPPSPPSFLVGGSPSTTASTTFTYDAFSYGGRIGASLQSPSFSSGAVNDVAGLVISLNGQAGDQLLLGGVPLTTSVINASGVVINGVAGLTYSYDSSSKELRVRKTDGSLIAPSDIPKIVTGFELKLSSSQTVNRTISYSYVDSVGNTSSPAVETVNFDSTVKIQPSAIKATKAGLMVDYVVTSGGVAATGADEKSMDLFQLSVNLSGASLLSGFSPFATTITSASQSFGQVSDPERPGNVGPLGATDPTGRKRVDRSEDPVYTLLLGQINDPLIIAKLDTSIYYTDSSTPRAFVGTVVGSTVKSESVTTKISLDNATSTSGRSLTISPPFTLKLGSSGSDTVTGTSGPDIIIPFSGSDVINPGPGADGIISGYGAKQIILNAGDSGSSFQVGETSSGAVRVIDTSSFDVVSGFGLYSLNGTNGELNVPLDSFKLPSGNNVYYVSSKGQPVFSTAGSQNSVMSLNEGELWLIRGEYSAKSDKFEIASTNLLDYASKSSLFVYRPIGSVSTEAVVLLGFSGTLQVASSGVIELVPFGENLNGFGVIPGTSGVDTLTGSSVGEIIRGLGADDVITPGKGPDIIQLAHIVGSTNSTVKLIQNDGDSGLFSNSMLVVGSSTSINTDSFDKVLWVKGSTESDTRQGVQIDLPDLSGGATYQKVAPPSAFTNFSLSVGQFSFVRGLGNPDSNRIFTAASPTSSQATQAATMLFYNAGQGTEAILLVGTANLNTEAINGSDISGVISIPGWI